MRGHMIHSDSRSFRKEDLKPRLMKNRNDPKVYGFICPRCIKRYGQPVDGYIYISRCDDCPPLTFKKDYIG